MKLAGIGWVNGFVGEEEMELDFILTMRLFINLAVGFSWVRLLKVIHVLSNLKWV